MNTTVAIVLPSWMVWLVAALCILQAVELIMRIYAMRSKMPPPDPLQGVNTDRRGW